MTTHEARHHEGTIPADQGVSKKIAAFDRQHELIASSDFAAWRDGAYKRQLAESAG